MARPRGACAEDHSGPEWITDRGLPRSRSATCTRCGKKKHWAEFTYSTKGHERGHNRSSCRECDFASKETPPEAVAVDLGESLTEVLSAIIRAQQSYLEEVAALRREIAALRELWETP